MSLERSNSIRTSTNRNQRGSPNFHQLFYLSKSLTRYSTLLHMKRFVMSMCEESCNLRGGCYWINGILTCRCLSGYSMLTPSPRTVLHYVSENSDHFSPLFSFSSPGHLIRSFSSSSPRWCRNCRRLPFLLSSVGIRSWRWVWWRAEEWTGIAVAKVDEARIGRSKE